MIGDQLKTILENDAWDWDKICSNKEKSLFQDGTSLPMRDKERTKQHSCKQLKKQEYVDQFKALRSRPYFFLLHYSRHNVRICGLFRNL
jgi:hypothetical protein